MVFVSIFSAITATIAVMALFLAFGNGAESTSALLLSVWGLVFFADFRAVIGARSLFYFSVLIFVIGRPVSAQILNLPYIEAGGSYLEKEIVLTNFIIANFLLLSFVGEFLFKKPAIFISQTVLSSIKPPHLPRFFLVFILAISYLVLSVFLVEAQKNSFFVTAQNYFDYAESEKSFVGYFFLGKYLLLVCVLFGDTRRREIIYGTAFYFAIGSIGFLFIGLRGYFLIYLLLSLAVLELEKKISFKYVLSIAAVVPLVAGLMLEARLGFKVFSGFLDTYSSFFYQQGATYEVVYGATVFKSGVRNCLETNYLVTNFMDQFGYCVDKARNVKFEAGGFATGAIAEFSFFLPWSVLLALVIGCLLAMTEAFHKHGKRLAGKGENISLALFVIILTLPAVTYFGRATIFELIFIYSELLIVAIILSLLILVLPTKRKK